VTILISMHSSRWNEELRDLHAGENEVLLVIARTLI
jgi:hypothetical protein